MKRKIFSIVLSLCMVLTMMPMATGVAWAVASTVKIGTAILNSTNQYYQNATFDPENGTLTLNGLVLNNESGYSIEAAGDLQIVLQQGSKNNLGHSNNVSNIIFPSGSSGNPYNLTISGPGTLTAVNGTSNYSTIYATGNITINGDAQVTATHAGGNAQAINAVGGKIEISGSNTKVEAQTGSAYALLAGTIDDNSGTIEIINSAPLTATANTSAVKGTMNIDTANSDEYAGDSTPGEKVANPNTDTYTAKYLKIEPKAHDATALEDRIFDYAYDASRRPDFPAKAGDKIEMYSLGYPLDANKEHMSTNAGSWTLAKTGTYSFIKNNNLNTGKLDSIVQKVFENYKSSNPSLKQDAIVIHELKDGTNHIAYGIVIAYNATEGYAVFVGDNWNESGSGYLLSTNVVTANSLNITAGTIATDFVQKLSIDLDHTDTHTFTSQTTETVKITNTGNDETGSLTVNLSGEYASSFILGKDETSGATISISSIAKDGNDTFTVAPKADLEAGTYTATVTVIGQNIVDKSFDVSFKVKAPSSSGSYTPTIQKPTVITDDGAEGTLSFYGDKLTIKVTDDYELADVILNGVSKGKVTELTGLKTGDKVEVKTEKKQEEPKEPTKEEIVAALKEQQLVARSKLTTSKSGRKAVLITWYDKNGNEVTFDGVEIYRSTKRDSGYGDEPIFVSKTGKYYNTAITEGTRYYYKVRGYVIIDGQKYYTDYSLKAIRTIK